MHGVGDPELLGVRLAAACYLMADGYAATYQELVETTDWDSTGGAATRAAPTAWRTAATSRRR